MLTSSCKVRWGYGSRAVLEVAIALKVLFILLLWFFSALVAQETTVYNRLSLDLQHDLENETVAGELDWTLEAQVSHELVKDWRIQGVTSMQSRLKVDGEKAGFDPSAAAEIYRWWLALGNPQIELRLGLQRLNFGVAHIYRPLQWFDRLHPLDPLEQTKGVESALFRGYFINNANLWLWLMPSQSETKGMETLISADDSWEFGSRLQYPVMIGETALTYHQREVDLPGSDYQTTEYRGGWDLRLDWLAGYWIETSVSHFAQAEQSKDWQKASVTVGLDYTFGIGNGLYVMSEYNMGYGGNGEWKRQNSSLAVMLDYPLSILDKVTLLTQYDLQHENWVQSLLWRRTYDRLSIQIGVNYSSGGEGPIPAHRLVQLTLNYDF